MRLSLYLSLFHFGFKAKNNRRRVGFASGLLSLSLAGLSTLAHAAAPAGTLIGNQASATYSDSSQINRTVTSNTVVTTVQQVASLTLTSNGAKTVSPGGQVYYPQTLTNTGNGDDSFALSAANTGSFSFSSVVFYADANGDGIPDNATPITNTGVLSAGQGVKFVVAGIVPSSAVTGNTNTITLTAASTFNSGSTASVTDVTTVTNQAVMQVTQALDVTSGASPAGPRTITLTYTNTGNAAASNLTLTEAIPSGMTYVANSARWSVTGSGVVLTDANASDSQSGVIYDFGVTSANQLRAVVASIPAGASGTLTFQVNVNSGLAPGASAATAATASYAYNDGVSPVSASSTNTVQYTVAQVSAVSMTGSTVASMPQGGTVSFTSTVTNNGNGSDTFDITLGGSTFPVGTTFLLFQADGVTPLVNSNANGTPDTGPLAAGASVNIVVKAVLPPGSTGGPYIVQPTATSALDTTKHATATDTLTVITGNSVDLTNDTVVPGATGVGAGPEVSATSTLTVNPGAVLRFPLVVSNSSGVADSFDLSASTDSTFGALSLPTGWSVVFRDGNGAVISGSGVINSGSSRAVYADVTLPPGAVAGTTQLYFRALSPATGAGDRLHDAVTVNTVRSIVLTSNNTGQVTAGGTMVYIHTLTNTGNVLEGDGSVSIGTLATSDSNGTFTSVVYWDKNNNGTLDPSDPVITNLSALTGGTNGASTVAGLSPGESAVLFVKVTAPAGAANGVSDTATLTAAITGSISSVSAPAAAIATDSTSVIISQVTLQKTQALDANCDGVADTVLSPNPITSGVLPGACLRYEITATNAGPVAVTGLVISDATPVQTTYHATQAAATTIGTVTAPTGGASGTVQATVGTLAPGQSVVLSFGVRITP